MKDFEVVDLWGSSSKEGSKFIIMMRMLPIFEMISTRREMLLARNRKPIRKTWFKLI